MTRVTTLAAINAAELRLFQSKRNTRQSLDRTRSALRTAIARPSTLVFVAVASGIWTFLLSARHRPSVKSVPNSADSAIRAPSRSLVRTFVSVYGTRLLTFALQHGAAAWKQSGAGVTADTPSNSVTENTTTTEHKTPGPSQHGVG